MDQKQAMKLQIHFWLGNQGLITQNYIQLIVMKMLHQLFSTLIGSLAADCINMSCFCAGMTLKVLETNLICLVISLACHIGYNFQG